MGDIISKSVSMYVECQIANSCTHNTYIHIIPRYILVEVALAKMHSLTIKDLGMPVQYVPYM